MNDATTDNGCGPPNTASSFCHNKNCSKEQNKTHTKLVRVFSSSHS